MLINEIAWSGTLASAYDEWIELHNPGSMPIDLTNWRLTDGGDLHVTLGGSIPAYGFFLLERTDESTIANIDADMIYTGGLKNSGESLRLLDPTSKVIDSADYPGGWPAGDAASRASMERRGGKDLPGNWATYSGFGGLGRDVNGNPIPGTPRQTNSLYLETSTPTATATALAQPQPTSYPPQAVMINEIAWAGTKSSSSDEWIELHNPGAEMIHIDGWKLSDGGDINIPLHGAIPGYGYYLLERTDETTVADIPANLIYTGSLKNDGEMLQLRDANGNLI
ncbi:MAG: hypothetical protein GTO14_17315, partial [Anaerolineales bacterium]|nr:hypothetical protein [Anaerolineales bacterium]